tara:strand:+ start:743 stop:1540 length:798 start_codon:yes stop_codon:yes gene_type:complete
MNYAEYYINNRIEFMTGNIDYKLIEGLINNIELIENKDVIAIDVGTCLGEYIENIDKLCKENNKKILCFEPNPLNIDLLKNKFEKRFDIELYKYSLSNKTEMGELFNWKGTINTIGNKQCGLRSGGDKICDVKIKRLDDVLDLDYIDKDIIIKFLKIDTEGNDTNIIKGMGKYLEYTKYIIFQCSDCLDDIRGPGIDNPMKDIVDYLSKNGFDTYKIGVKKLLKVNDEYWNETYENIKFWSNCFSLKKNDKIINKIIDEDFNYIY